MNTEKPEKHQKRIHYLLNKRLQVRMLGWMFLITVAVVASIAFAITIYIFNICRVEAFDSLNNTGVSIILPCTLIAGIILWFVLTVIAWIAFRITHRIAGPAHKFHQVIQSIIQGNLDIAEIRLRKKDELHELAQDLNQLVQTLQERQNSGKKETDT